MVTLIVRAVLVEDPHYTEDKGGGWKYTCVGINMLIFVTAS